MIKLALIIFALALLFWLIFKISRPYSGTSELNKQKKVRTLLALMVILAVILLISRTGISPAVILQKILQLLPAIRTLLPFWLIFRPFWAAIQFNKTIMCIKIFHWIHNLIMPYLDILRHSFLILLCV